MVSKQRFYSLDVFRGATVCLMILVNNPGSWSYIYPPLEHASWHGLTPTDLVFPFFLFAVGNAFSFVMPRLRDAGPKAFWQKIIQRTLIIFGIGLLLNWLPFVTHVHRFVNGADTLQEITIFKGFTWIDYSQNIAGQVIETVKGIRLLGVLQRIALCYFFASIIIYYLQPRKAFFFGMFLLLCYWVLCYLANPADPYSLQGWLGTAIDKSIFGEAHLYHGEGVAFDPEGLMSTLPAIVQVIFGYMVGFYIQHRSRETLNESAVITSNGLYRMLSGLFVIGVALLITGYCWNWVFPINKKIWTSSYVVFTSGLAIVLIATMIYFIEIKKKRSRLFQFFNVFGKNALFVFALSGFLPRVLPLISLGDGINPWNWMYKKVFIHTPGIPENGSLLYALFVISLMWLICYLLDKKKIYIKV